ncbi:NUDIX domain-containing protein [Candidatus Bathyarchaeota archaeon]|nr:NUDIX domain-containing protein [Candidatus Bathyarchaeota archaeon]
MKSVEQDAEVLLVKRVESPHDPWSGQMAFPGGKRDESDQDLKQTVVRETLEETNIDLLDHGLILGVMTPFRSTERPEMKILPFVVLLQHQPFIRLNEELEDHLWIPLAELDRCRGSAKFSFGAYPAYLVGDKVIWGLTYRILHKLLDILQCSQ